MRDFLADSFTMIFEKGIEQGIHLVENYPEIITNLELRERMISNAMRWFKNKLTN